MTRLKELWGVLVLLCAAIQGAWAQKEPVTYLERSWDSKNNCVVTETKTCTDYEDVAKILPRNSEHFGYRHKNEAWYVVRDKLTIRKIRANRDVHFILCDGAELHCDGISIEYLYKGDTEGRVFIHSQSDGDNQGKLFAIAKTDGWPGMGATPSGWPNGTYVIHGGKILARGANGGAGIGGAATKVIADRAHERSDWLRHDAQQPQAADCHTTD